MIHTNHGASALLPRRLYCLFATQRDIYIYIYISSNDGRLCCYIFQQNIGNVSFPTRVCCWQFRCVYHTFCLCYCINSFVCVRIPFRLYAIELLTYDCSNIAFQFKKKMLKTSVGQRSIQHEYAHAQPAYAHISMHLPVVIGLVYTLIEIMLWLRGRFYLRYAVCGKWPNVSHPFHCAMK